MSDAADRPEERRERFDVHVYHHFPTRPLEININGDLDVEWVGALTDAIKVELLGSIPTSLRLTPGPQTPTEE